jgi:hypothetical protein
MARRLQNGAPLVSGRQVTNTIWEERDSAPSSGAVRGDKMRMSSRWLFALLAVAGVTLPGCAQQVEDVNRVQPHYIDKAMLEGDWYYRQTIVDVPPQSGIGFVGLEGGLAKVRWEIRENELIAYRMHETIPGIDGLQERPGTEYKGDPVASFRITEHFDIVRDYNTSTGEQSNVIEEDSDLRPWYERKYMRVDWSSNTLFDPVDFGGVFSQLAALTDGTVEWVRETDKFDPDRLRAEDGLVQFTVRYAHSADTLPTCYYTYGQGVYSLEPCGEVEVKIRHSFVRMDPDEAKDFEAKSYFDREVLKADVDGSGREQPIKYTTVSVGRDKSATVPVACTPEVLEALGPDVTLSDCQELGWNQAGKFGFFRTERHGYSRLTGGANDNLRQFYANHHKIWKKELDAQGQPLPLKDRELRPVVYYLNATFPDDLVDSAVELGKDWNEAFMQAAMAATGRSREALEGQLDADFQKAPGHQDALFLADDYGSKALFQVRRNTCSKEGITRYVQRHPELQDVVDEATEGKGVLIGNLERVCTGLVAESRDRGIEDAFEWQQVGDLRFSFIFWVNESQPGGPLGYGPSSADPESGRIISGNAYIYGNELDAYARSSVDIVRALNGETTLNEILDGDTYLQWIKSGTTVADQKVPITNEFKQEISRRLGTDAMGGQERFMKSGGGYDPAAMVRDMQHRLANPQSDDPLRYAMEAPVDRGHARLEQLAKDPAWRARMVTPEILSLVGPLFNWHEGEEIPPEMMNAATAYAVNPGTFDRWKEARQKLLASDKCVFMADFLDDSVIGLALTLKGHDPEEVYQTLRKTIFRAVTLHEVGHTVGLTHNFEGSFDSLNYKDGFWDILEQYPDDEAARDQAQWPEYRYASIMDYGSRFNSDIRGLGKYDYAAIKFMYGDTVEEFDDSVKVPGDLQFKIDFEDYSKLPDTLGGAGNISKRKLVPIEQEIEQRKQGVLANARKFAENPNRPVTDYWVDRTVPYMYCDNRQLGDLKCRVFDEGANHTEAVKSAIQRYWNYFVFNSYRRGRNEVAFLNAFFSRQDSLAEYLTYPWKYYFFFDRYPVGLRDDLLQASLMGLNFINQVIGSPEPGRFCLDAARNMYMPEGWYDYDEQNSCHAIDVPLGVGRHSYLEFSDDYVYQYDYIGTYYEKTAFLYQLFDSATRFLRINDYYNTDTRRFAISYYSAFRDELLTLTREMARMYLTGALLAPYGRTFYQNDINQTFFNALLDPGVASPANYYLTRSQDIIPSLLVDPTTFGGTGGTGTNTRPRVYTAVPYNELWLMMLYGSALGTTLNDRQLDYVDYLAISQPGSGDDRVCAADAQKVSFTHPRTGAAFEACQTNDGKSVAVDMVHLAQDFVDHTWQPALDALDGARQKLADDQDALAQDPNNQRLQDKVQADQQDVENRQAAYDYSDVRLQTFVELMDDMRSLRSAFDWGSF